MLNALTTICVLPVYNYKRRLKVENNETNVHIDTTAELCKAYIGYEYSIYPQSVFHL